MNLNSLLNMDANLKNNSISIDNLKNINNENLDSSINEFENIFNKVELEDLSLENEFIKANNYFDASNNNLIKSDLIETDKNYDFNILKEYEAKPLSLILLNLLNNDAQNKDLLIEEFSKEFSIPKQKLESLITNYIKEAKTIVSLEGINNDDLIKSFINELNLNDKNLNKAMDLLSNIIGKHIVKENIITAQKTYNTEELFLAKDYNALNKGLYKLNDSNLIKDKDNVNIKPLKEASFLKEISDFEASSDYQDTNKNANQDLNSGTNLNFSKHIDFINKDYSINELNIDERVNINLVKDTIINNVKILSDKDGGFIKLDLKSMDLGNLSLKVETLNNSKIAINVICDNHNTKKLLESNLNDLKSALANLNIKADSININLNENNKFDTENSRKDYLASNDKGNDKQKDQNKKESKN